MMAYPTRLNDLLNLHHRQIQSIISEAITESAAEKDMTVRKLSYRVRTLGRAMDQLGWEMRYD